MDSKHLIKKINGRNNDLNGFAMRIGFHPDYIDKNLYKEDIEIIRLHYDKAGKMLTIGTSTFIGSVALTVAFIGLSKLGFRFFLITALISIPRTFHRNVTMNKCFSTLKKKIKNN